MNNGKTMLKNIKKIGAISIAAIFLAVSFMPAVPTAKAATDAVLSFDQATVSVETGDTVTLVARVNPGTNEVGAVELDVTFNPSILQLDSITRSDAFNTTLGGPTIDNTGTEDTDGTGSIDVGLLTSPATYITTTSDVATFVFTALSTATNSPVVFAATSDASAHGEYVVLTRTPSRVTVTDPEEPGDSTAPVISNGTPSGELSRGTTTSTISVTTNENATCKYSTSSGVAYASMTGTFTTTGTTTHSFAGTGFSNGNGYRYYVRCQDSATNVNASDYTISFSIDKSSSKKKEVKKKKRKIYNSQKKLRQGEVLVQRGKRFSKNSTVMLYFSKYGGGYYAPVTIKTSGSGTFSVSYRINKPRGTYSWYALDVKTGKKSKIKTYRVR
ncbi:MAG TPA: cohesin domain-containing protein [Candidatus Moranbacteria bacterium]|nr:cohesin domain-containing protein [Candidatus Moranbacteria bacterium]